MPADRIVALQPGSRGTNLRDQASGLRDGELTDSLNWQIGQRGILEKRLGYSPLGNLPAAILELFCYQPAGGVPQLVAYCDNGQVYTSTDGAAWTSIASGLSTAARPTFAQYLDNLYWANGVDSLQQWDGTTLTAITSAPLGTFVAVWRNRIWIAGITTHPHRVAWSKQVGVTDWTSFPLNWVEFPNYPPITALVTAPNISTGADGADGVLVFTSSSMHRIVDDTDNVSGAVIGGANVLIDASTGCVSYRSVAQTRGRLYVLANDGVYSTNGHDPLRSESKMIDPAFHGGATLDESCCAVVYQGRYVLAFSTAASAYNNRVAELYLDEQANEQGQYPWMFHDPPVSAWAVYPATAETLLYFADSSPGDTSRVRWLYHGGADTDGATNLVDVLARFRTGASLLGVATPKSIVRAYVFGRGVLNLAVSTDFVNAAGESHTLRIERSGVSWNAFSWGEAKWGGDAGAQGAAAYYTKRGRWVTFEVTESSQNVGPPHHTLGVTTRVSGGAAFSQMHLTVRPLDAP